MAEQVTVVAVRIAAGLLATSDVFPKKFQDNDNFYIGPPTDERLRNARLVRITAEVFRGLEQLGVTDADWLPFDDEDAMAQELANIRWLLGRFFSWNADWVWTDNDLPNPQTPSYNSEIHPTTYSNLPVWIPGSSPSYTSSSSSAPDTDTQASLVGASTPGLSPEGDVIMDDAPEENHSVVYDSGEDDFEGFDDLGGEDIGGDDFITDDPGRDNSEGEVTDEGGNVVVTTTAQPSGWVMLSPSVRSTGPSPARASADNTPRPASSSTSAATTPRAAPLATGDENTPRPAPLATGIATRPNLKRKASDDEGDEEDEDEDEDNDEVNNENNNGAGPSSTVPALPPPANATPSSSTRPYTCDECNTKKTFTANGLKGHKKCKHPKLTPAAAANAQQQMSLVPVQNPAVTGAGGELFPCEHCPDPKPTFTAHGMKMHYAALHPSEKFTPPTGLEKPRKIPCPYCGDMFEGRGLGVHVKHRHPGMPKLTGMKGIWR